MKFDRGVATYTQKRICVHIWTKNMGRFYHNSYDYKRVRRTIINLSKNQFWMNLWWCLYHLLIGNHYLPQVNEGLIIYNFYNLP